MEDYRKYLEKQSAENMVKNLPSIRAAMLTRLNAKHNITVRKHG
jgi:hypothetical protein